MTTPEPGPGPAASQTRARREPPPFRPATVLRAGRLSPRMVRLTLGGEQLRGLAVADPAASIRLLLPPPGTGEPVVPAWTGNEFLLPDGARPAIRTLTPRRTDPEAGEVDVDVVVHGGGVASRWAERAVPGDAVALSGPGRGYAVEASVDGYLLAGDETAIPAMGQLLEAIPADRTVRVLIEVAAPEARLPLPAHPGASVEWLDAAPGSAPGDALVTAVAGADVGAGTRVWVAGEAAAVQRIRRHLFEERSLSRAQATVRGYWKHGRTAGTEDDTGG